MNIPEKVKIGAHIYQITFGDYERMKLLKLDGEIDYTSKVIYLRKEPNYNEAYVHNVLIHEILHGIAYESGMGHINNDEKAIECMGNTLYQVLIDNLEMLD